MVKIFKIQKLNLINSVKFSSNITIEDEKSLSELLNKEYKDVEKKEKVSKISLDYTIYIDMSDNLILTLYTLSALNNKVKNEILEPAKKTDTVQHQINIHVVLLAPVVKKFYMRAQDKDVLMSVMDSTNTYINEHGKRLYNFPGYSNIKSNLEFIVRRLAKMQLEINFTSNANVLDKHILRKIKELLETMKLKFEQSCIHEMVYDVNIKKIYTIKRENIKANSIYIPQEKEVLSEKNPMELFHNNLEKAMTYYNHKNKEKEEDKNKKPKAKREAEAKTKLDKQTKDPTTTK